MNLENLTTHIGEPVTLNTETILSAINKLKEANRDRWEYWDMNKVMAFYVMDDKRLPVIYGASA